MLNRRMLGTSFNIVMDRRLRILSPDIICLAGFLRILPPEIVRRYEGRILNIHPSLLPKFGGKGMYGRKVHEAVLRAGERASGCTVHYVTEEVDNGPVILQRRVDVYPEDTPETLEQRVHSLELEAYPEAIRIVLESMR